MKTNPWATAKGTGKPVRIVERTQTETDHIQFEQKTVQPEMIRHSDASEHKSDYEKIIRDDVPIHRYSIAPLRKNMKLHNTELMRFISDFSRENQLAGGTPIKMSMVIELALELLYYDLNVRPLGFQDLNQLRNYIQQQIQKSAGDA